MFFGFLAPKHVKIVWLSSLLTMSVPDEGYFFVCCCCKYIISIYLRHHKQHNTITEKTQYYTTHPQYIKLKKEIDNTTESIKRIPFLFMFF